jgi:hypothetical protein
VLKKKLLLVCWLVCLLVGILLESK